MLTFSNKRKFSGCIAFSPNSKFFAISKGLELIIYDNKYLKPYQNFSFCDFIEDIQWSKNSELILVGLYKRARCEIRNIENSKWYCSIDEGVKGMKYSLFSPDSLHILSICDHNIKLSIRSLVDKSLLYINFPKFAKKGLSFSSKGNFMALAERNEAKDYIGIYYVNKWTCIKKFLVETEDLQDVKWTYDNSALLIPDTPTLCILYIYSPIGDLISKIEMYQYKMGIKSLDISPNGHYICLGLYDQSLRIFNNISYICVTIFEHDKEVLNDIKVNYYREELLNNEGETKYEQIKPPIILKNENFGKSKNNNISEKSTKIGVSKMAFSFDNYFLATKNDKMPNILFIWDLNQMNLQFVLIQLNEVIYFEWAKNKNILFISTNNNKLYYFTLDSCKILQLSKDFNNKSLLFSSDGKTMVIKDTNNFIMVNMENEEEIEDDRIRKGINEDYSNEHMKVEENYVNEDKDRNGEEDENELENNEEGEEMEEQMEENHSQEIKLNNNIAFEEEVGMNPDS
jgi:WD40 repeat protein